MSVDFVHQDPTPDEYVELADNLENFVELGMNSEPRCACVLLLDTSGSMQGEPIRELNLGLSEFQHALQADDLASMRVEVAIVSFGGNDEVIVEQDFVIADQYVAKELSASGRTPMGAAVERALDMIGERKAVYRKNGVPYYRPWIWLITDGAPTDEWRHAAQRVHSEEDQEGVAFFSVGVQGANMQTLGELSVRQPLHLKGLGFSDMFTWLSGSLSSVSRSSPEGQIALESPMGWANI